MVDDKRRQILEGVWGVIAQHGLSAVSVRSVAAAAGVSAGRVQHYFPTKSELVRASVGAMLVAAESENPEAGQDTSERETLWALLTHAIDPATGSRAGVSVFYAFVAAGVTDPWIADTLAQAKSSLIDKVAQCLAEQHPGLEGPGAMAKNLVALSDGLTQAVYLGYTSSDEARDGMARALGELQLGTEPPRKNR